MKAHGENMKSMKAHGENMKNGGYAQKTALNYVYALELEGFQDIRHSWDISRSTVSSRT